MGSRGVSGLATFFPGLADLVVLSAYAVDTEQTSINAVGFQVTSTVTGGASLPEIAAAYGNRIGGPLRAVLSNNAFFRGVGARDITFVPKQAAAYSTSGAGAGSAGADGLPRQTAGLLSIYDGLAGKGHRGRFYVPFPAAADNTGDGKPTAAYGLRLATLATAVFTALVVVGASGTSTLTPGLVHRRANKLPLPFPTFTASGVPFIRNVWATQRRRGSYGRPNSSPV